MIQRFPRVMKIVTFVTRCNLYNMHHYNLSKVQIFLMNEKNKIDSKKILWYTVTKPQLHRRSQMEEFKNVS